MTPSHPPPTVAVVTGASSGIGRAISLGLASQRIADTLVLVGRNEAALETTRFEVMKTPAATCEIEVCDFADLDSVKRLGAVLAARHPRISVLCSNAGLITRSERTTDQGFELTWQVNYLAGFQLIAALRASLKDSRVILTSSKSYEDASIRRGSDDEHWGWALSPWRAGEAYANSKLANILMVREAARRWPDVSVYSFHPGEVRTHFGRGTIASAYFRFNPLLRSATKGAETAIWLAGCGAAEAASGAYYADRNPVDGPAPDHSFESLLWDTTQQRLDIRG